MLQNKKLHPANFGHVILDDLAAIRLRLQLATDGELADLTEALINHGFDREPVILEMAGDLGGIAVRARMEVILYRHSEDGVGEHRWNLIPEGRVQLVEGRGA